MANLNDINLTTVVQLKEKCISHGLSIAGKKADLFERLKEYEEKRNAAAAAPGENPVPAVKDESTKATVDGNLETSVIKTDDKSDEKLMAEVEAVINDGVNVEVKDVKNENAAECEKTGSKTNEVSSTEENTPKTLSVAEKYDQQMKEILETLKKKHSCETITDKILKEFLCDKVEEDIFCKLCVFKAQGGEELVLEDHFQSETHKTRYEGYKEKCLDNGNFLRVISHCEICKKEIPYDVFNKHETGAKHLLNKMLTENGVAPMKLDRAQIQEELDAINTAEDPVPGIKFVIEEINGEDMETFSIKYFCLACRLVNDKKLSPEEMIEHIKSKAHKIGSLRRLSNRAFKAVQAMVNAYNSSKPVKSVALDLGDECANYIKKNVSQFYRKMTISTNIWIGGIKNIEMHHQGDDFSFAEEIEAREKAREKARMDGRNRREQGRKDAKNKNAEGKQDKDTATTVEKNTFENTEAKIQKLVNENITDIIGIEYLIERHYPDGVLDYHCSTCGKELGTDQSAAIVHFTHFRHKKAYLKRNKKEEHENMIKRAKDTKNSDRDINLEIQRLTEEVSQKFLDSKTERPKVRVTVKDGPRKDTQPARQRKRKQSISKGGPEKKPDISGNKVSTIGTGGRKGVSKKRGAGGGFGGGSGGGGGGGFGNAKRRRDDRDRDRRWGFDSRRRNDNRQTGRNSGRQGRYRDEYDAMSLIPTGYNNSYNQMSDYGRSMQSEWSDWDRQYQQRYSNMAFGSGSGGFGNSGSQSGKLMSAVNELTSNVNEDDAAMILKISSVVSQQLMQAKQRGGSTASSSFDIQTQVQNAFSRQQQQQQHQQRQPQQQTQQQTGWGNYAASSGYTSAAGTSAYTSATTGYNTSTSNNSSTTSRNPYSSQQIAPPTQNSWNFDY